MRAQSVSGQFGLRKRGSFVSSQHHRLVSQEKQQGVQNAPTFQPEKLGESSGHQRFSQIYDSLPLRVLPSQRPNAVNSNVALPNYIEQSRKRATFANAQKQNLFGGDKWIALQPRITHTSQGQLKTKVTQRQDDSNSEKYAVDNTDVYWEQAQRSPPNQMQKQVISKLSIPQALMGSPKNNYSAHYNSQMDMMYLQVSDELQSMLVRDSDKNSRLSRAAKNRTANTGPKENSESGAQLSQSAVIPDRDWFRSGQQSSQEVKLPLDRLAIDVGMTTPVMMAGEQANEKMTKSEVRGAVVGSREKKSSMKILTRNPTQIIGTTDQNYSKRSFSAAKTAPKQSAKDQSVQLMIMKVKQQCTQKKYNDPLEIKKEKDRMKEVKVNSPLASAGGMMSASKASQKVIGSAQIRLRSMKGEDVGQEDDDDDSIDGSNDVSLDLDDDDDDNESNAMVKKNSFAVVPSQTQGLGTVSKSNVVLLKSIYSGRPMTVFFQYHKSCQQPKARDVTRTVVCSEFEAKKFDLKYKVEESDQRLWLGGQLFLLQINGDNPYKCVMKAFEENGFTATDEGDWNTQWSLPKKDKVRGMNPFKKFNHFPGCWNLGRKDFMWRCLNRAKRRSPKEMDFVPNTYLLCNQGDWDRFLAKKEEASKNQLWICKPADQACGRGIKVISKTSRVKRKTNRIICDYIMNPHLIDGLKYDLRLYVLVTSYDPLRIYLYEEGLTRFATEKYTTNTKEVTKRYVHLTNYSVNKYAKKFVKNTGSETDGEGSKWSHSALRAKYASMGIDVKELFRKISDVIIKTCISAEPTMLDIHAKSSEHRTNCFELYGFDVLIDANLKPWILEVNVCPSLSSSSPLDRKIKHSLLVDTLNIVGITPYDKKHYNEQNKKGSGGSLLHRASTTTMVGDMDDSKSGGSLVNIKKTFSKNVNDIQDLNAQNCLDKLSPENWEILFETDEEYHRRGHFERIYPPMEAERRQYYAQFYEYQRFNNIMVDKWMSSSANFLQKVIRKRYNTSV